MINHIKTGLVQGMQAKATQKRGQGERSQKSAEPDATLQIRYAPMIAKAIGTPAADAEAVKVAQKMLANGDLDRPEIIREAAQNLVDFGP
jgi:hypothetical protein